MLETYFLKNCLYYPSIKMEKFKYTSSDNNSVLIYFKFENQSIYQFTPNPNYKVFQFLFLHFHLLLFSSLLLLFFLCDSLCKLQLFIFSLFLFLFICLSFSFFFIHLDMSFYEISDLGSHPSSRSLFKTEQKIELTTEKKINYKDGRTVLMKKSGFFFHLGFFFNFGVF